MSSVSHCQLPQLFVIYTVDSHVHCYTTGQVQTEDQYSHTTISERGLQANYSAKCVWNKGAPSRARGLVRFCCFQRCMHIGLIHQGCSFWEQLTCVFSCRPFPVLTSSPDNSNLCHDGFGHITDFTNSNCNAFVCKAEQQLAFKKQVVLFTSRQCTL